MQEETANLVDAAYDAVLSLSKKAEARLLDDGAEWVRLPRRQAERLIRAARMHEAMQEETDD